MPEAIDLRTNPQPISDLPIGTLITGKRTNPDDETTATDTVWKITGPGTMRKVRG